MNTGFKKNLPGFTLGLEEALLRCRKLDLVVPTTGRSEMERRGGPATGCHLTGRASGGTLNLGSATSVLGGLQAPGKGDFPGSMPRRQWPPSPLSTCYTDCPQNSGTRPAASAHKTEMPLLVPVSPKHRGPPGISGERRCKSAHWANKSFFFPNMSVESHSFRHSVIQQKNINLFEQIRVAGKESSWFPVNSAP